MVFYKNSELNETCEVVTFYFSNIPEDIVHEDIHQGFLALGVLLDVFLSKRRTELGKRFGFVLFRSYTIRANVAQFQKNDGSAEDIIVFSFGAKHGAENITIKTRSNFGGNIVTRRSFADTVVGAEGQRPHRSQNNQTKHVNVD